MFSFSWKKNNGFNGGEALKKCKHKFGRYNWQSAFCFGGMKAIWMVIISLFGTLPQQFFFPWKHSNKSNFPPGYRAWWKMCVLFYFMPHTNEIPSLFDNQLTVPISRSAIATTNAMLINHFADRNGWIA